MSKALKIDDKWRPLGQGIDAIHTRNSKAKAAILTHEPLPRHGGAFI